MLIVGGNQSAGGYEVDNSLRFDGSSSYLRKTFSGTSTNSKKCTMSFWSKRTAIGENNTFLTANIGGSASRDRLYFTAANEIEFFLDNATDGNLRTNRLFRDPSAWYHVIVAIDTTQATAANRVKLYVNGTQETSFAAESYPAQNYDLTGFGNSVEHTIGADDSDGGSNEYYNGYMAEAVFVNGLALDPTSFGEFDEDSGIWKPISVSGLTFGTNGFYLQFQDSSALGDDTSGNSNDFTLTGISSIDQTTDTPTNNFATLNGLFVSQASNASTSPLKEGNLVSTNNGTNTNFITESNMAMSAGTWYMEWKVGADVSGGVSVGIRDNDITQTIANGTGTVQWQNNGFVKIDNSITTTIATYTTNDILGLLYNATSGTLVCYKNGASQGTIFSAGSGKNWTFYGIRQNTATNYSDQWNFGNPTFTISTGNSDPSGYGNFEYSTNSGYALNTKNLAEYG